ncbi:MAG: hypothetical protein HC880_05610 [Bacteroidia bacterium]|nr:hypothetical protein [Bacteroidia bacterium]
MRKFLYLFLLAGFITGQQGGAQSVYIPLNEDYYHWIDRFEIKSGHLFDRLHTQLKPFTRETIAQLADSAWSALPSLSRSDQFNLNYLKNDSWEWSTTAEGDSKRPFLKKTFRKKSDFYHVDEKNFDLHLNPVLYGFVGFENDQENTPYLNSRGLELRGRIARKVGFYSFWPIIRLLSRLM